MIGSTCPGRDSRHPRIVLCIVSALTVWPPTLYAAWKWKEHENKLADRFKSFILQLSYSHFYLQEKKQSSHIVLWNPVSQKCLFETKELIIVQVIIERNGSISRTIFLRETITCITKALCMLIQKASFSSCFNFPGFTWSNWQINDLKQHKRVRPLKLQETE